MPVVEWWDEIFLSKENREARKKLAKFGASSSGSSSGSSGGDVFAGVSIVHVRTHMYVPLITVLLLSYQICASPANSIVATYLFF